MSSFFLKKSKFDEKQKKTTKEHLPTCARNFRGSDQRWGDPVEASNSPVCVFGL
jgi:hypothetical protein